MYPSLGWPCSSCEFLHSTLGRTCFSAHRLTGSNTQHDILQRQDSCCKQTLSWLVTSIDSSTQSKFIMFFVLLPCQTYFQRLSLKESHEVPLVAHFGLSGSGISGAFWILHYPNGFQKNVISLSTSEVFWVRRLQRRRVPVTKVLGSNATMIPAALAWAVELKVRHIADFVDQKMDMLLVRTRPRGWWGLG